MKIWTWVNQHPTWALWLTIFVVAVVVATVTSAPIKVGIGFGALLLLYFIGGLGMKEK